ncbi:MULTISPECIES: amino acid ABC transporter permease [unclassified Sinorhizobium]|uniref:amino acid ABC transporter permease n=1 Tax=unclassified Sinorhizobium TaxID=2613772 RepID=UPI0024C25110|nr:MULTISPECIES: amino acid ABC transporter permease [unclassified Sinorhizobium]MDK1374314.1 amino acid ABC transporter permease [Sinorhizobium sp. 6-70]MDK1479458.1 amino acid ABC transporter permease [Sinorhizobium sp. 6-117]
MTITDTTPILGRPALATPPRRSRKPVVHVFFGDLAATSLTVATGFLLLSMIPAINWAVFDANWTTGDPATCREGGACWAFIAAKFRFIIFGVYPPDQQWRPLVVMGLIITMVLASLSPRLWGRKLAYGWVAAIAAMLTLMWGGVLGMALVPTSSWGGLPVTLLLALLSLGLGFPFAVFLALGRRSKLPVPRLLSILTIELVRGLPLVGLLFVASILLPLLLPAGWTIDKLGRTLAALTVFAAAYLAEVIRGGLQGLPPGQVEAAKALGIPGWKTVWHIVLPQALQKVIPPLTNTAIVMVKNTSLVLIVGVFDMLSASRVAATDPLWPAPYVESYVFVAAIYFVICFGISNYARWLESRVQARTYR